ncbi:unnamed protein product [Didymodactylos carnosus]|uniref:Helix-turn-helix domain-containing protein n=1 Tax=Didymodactylos carnosus TaxID=1234261 RepID=A0A815LLU1_9BILA|nr:unnamed protein product [Didymodactylos carnosus]CAF4296841.1 unnamed protein product [Didymodactylos carnosus]
MGSPFTMVLANIHMLQLEQPLIEHQQCHDELYDRDHPRSVHRTIVYGGLLRIIRFCSHVDDFDREQLKFELTLITSGYPLRFIKYHFKRFFADKTKKRRQIITDPDDLEQYLPKKKPWDREKLILHYRYESSPIVRYRQEFGRFWKDSYVNDPSRVKDVRLTVGIRINPSLEHRLVKKRPPQVLLNNRNDEKAVPLDAAVVSTNIILDPPPANNVTVNVRWTFFNGINFTHVVMIINNLKSSQYAAMGLGQNQSMVIIEE